MDNVLDCADVTDTTRSQREVELLLLKFLRFHCPDVAQLWKSHPDYDMPSPHDSDDLTLERKKHMEYLSRSLLSIPESAQHLYCAQPWLVYWSLQAADMLGLTEELAQIVPRNALASFLLACLRDGATGEAAHCPNIHSTEADCTPRGDGGKAAQADSLGKQRLCDAYAFSPVCACGAHDTQCAVGFAGGRAEQLPHLAVTYAAVCALCILSDTEALRAVPRAALRRWLLSLREPDGSFCMHVGGEADIRASYCVAVVTTLLQLESIAENTSSDFHLPPPLLSDAAARFVASCQTHEGGFACGRNASEAHGAYTQCGLAALLLMKRPELCNYTSLRRWLAARQHSYEGGFNGRTNKLVDSCYSHWVGASHVMLRAGEVYARLLQCDTCGDVASSSCANGAALTAREALLLHHAQLDASAGVRMDMSAWRCEEITTWERMNRVTEFVSTETPTGATAEEDVGDFFFDQRRLQRFVLSCCQNRKCGGMMDKPLCPNDAYHTCYALSGISSAQNRHLAALSLSDEDSLIATARRENFLPSEAENWGTVTIGSDPSAALRPTNPIFNLNQYHVLRAVTLWGVKTVI